MFWGVPYCFSFWRFGINEESFSVVTSQRFGALAFYPDLVYNRAFRRRLVVATRLRNRSYFKLDFYIRNLMK